MAAEKKSHNFLVRPVQYSYKFSVSDGVDGTMTDLKSWENGLVTLLSPG